MKPQRSADARGSVVPRTGVTSNSATANPATPPCQPASVQVQRDHHADRDEDLEHQQIDERDEPLRADVDGGS